VAVHCYDDSTIDVVVAIIIIIIIIDSKQYSRDASEARAASTVSHTRYHTLSFNALLSTLHIHHIPHTVKQTAVSTGQRRISH